MFAKTRFRVGGNSRVARLALPVLALGLSACSSSDESSASFGGDTDNLGGEPLPGQGQVPGLDPGANSSAGSTGSGPLPPVLSPEQEVEAGFRVPVATGNFVWSANPESGQVALVDVRTLEVETMAAGLGPTYLAAVPDLENPEHNAAIVINTQSHDATFFDQDARGCLTSETIMLHEGANAWAISPSGRWAIAWSDFQQVANADATEGFQDLTLIDLSTTPPKPTRLSVGYRPSAILINTAESQAYAVTEPGISVLELGDEPMVLQDLEFDTGAPDVSRDVSISRDGELALVREEGSPSIRVLSLTTGEAVVVELSSAVTDLDLTADGKLAVAVARESAQVALLRVPEVFSDLNSVRYVTVLNNQVGSVTLAESGQKAFLFTNAVASDKLTILDLQDDSQRTVALKAPVEAVFSAPDGSHAIALLKPAPGSSRAGAFAVVPVASRLPPKIQGTDAAPIAVAMLSEGMERGLVTVSDTATGIFGAYVIRMPELQVDFEKLASPPSASGIVAQEGIGFVAQKHAEGRISFFDLDSGAVRTLTGFELASRVIDAQ